MQVLAQGEERTEELTSRLKELSSKIGDSNFALDGGYKYKQDAHYTEEEEKAAEAKKVHSRRKHNRPQTADYCRVHALPRASAKDRDGGHQAQCRCVAMMRGVDAR